LKYQIIGLKLETNFYFSKGSKNRRRSSFENCKKKAKFSLTSIRNQIEQDTLRFSMRRSS
jgi:hypothetical protein